MAPVDGYDSGSGMCVFPEERVGGRCKKRIDGVCRRSYGGGISMVVADTFDGVLGFFRGVAGDTDDCRFFLGIFFLLCLDHFTPHQHVDSSEPEGPKSRLSKTSKLALAVTIHNIPEGIAVGITLAGAMDESAIMTMSGALALSIGIAIQNFPEGAIVSMPMREAGNSRKKSFLIGVLSGLVEPVASIVTICVASMVLPVFPYLLAFGAGAMIYVVVEELIPETAQGRHSNLGTIGFAVGFAVMMVLDVVLG